MRLEIDPELNEMLDKIKEERWGISGRGHTGTVRFLANYYRDTEPIAKQLKTFIDGLAVEIRRSFVEGLREVLADFLSDNIGGPR
jgi:hypothetical protein